MGLRACVLVCVRAKFMDSEIYVERERNTETEREKLVCTVLAGPAGLEYSRGHTKQVAW